MASEKLPELAPTPLTFPMSAPILATTVERQRGFIPKRRTRVSYQKGSIEKKESGKFLLRYRVRDAKHSSGWRKVAELMDATTDKAAEKERVRKMRAINETNEKTPAADEAACGTFREFKLGLWQTHLKNKGVKPSTIYGYESLLNKHILPVLGDRKLSEIMPVDITEFMNALGSQPSKRKPKLLNVYSLMRHMFELATEYDLVQANPVRKKLHRPRYRVKEKPILTPEQLGQVLAKIPQDWYAVFLMLILTSLRIGEVLAIQWRDIDWLNTSLRLNKNLWRGEVQESTKTGAEIIRHLPVAGGRAESP